MDNQGYTGFTFNGKHSSEFNIKRTSDGDRYNENLLPTIQDKTVQIPGADGTYFYGSYFTQRIFNVSFAFDSLTEGQLAALKAHFGDKKIHELIFDETPYKKYRAKVTGSATFKYIPFAEGVTNRVYKGEGTLQFTAYDPYACSVHKYLNEYHPAVSWIKHIKELQVSQDISQEDEALLQEVLRELGYLMEGKTLKDALQAFNSELGINSDGFMIETQNQLIALLDELLRPIYEWKEAANLLETQGDFDITDIKLHKDARRTGTPLYNPGSKEADFVLKIRFFEMRTDGTKGEWSDIPESVISIGGKEMSIGPIKHTGTATHIVINTKLELIEEYRSPINGKFIKTGKIHNNCINSGSFFKIPVTTEKNPQKAPNLVVSENLIPRIFGLEYDYQYL